MSLTTRILPCTPEQVFTVLTDGWSYTGWVVGASRVRAVDTGWPQVGTRIYHSVGAWPLLIDDTTEVLAYDPPRMLKLQGRAWPAGEATITVTVTPGPAGVTVQIGEEVSSGPARLIPSPVENALLERRNRESLLRLEMLVKGRAGIAIEENPS